MPEPIPHADADPPASPPGGRTQSVADPNATTGGEPGGTTATSPSPSQRYALLDEIAHGGMGVVYRATDTALGREVAVKVLQDKFAPNSGTARRFADEARITAQLQHPGIPAVHDLGTLPDGRPFLAMKLIKGQTLEELLAARPDVAAERGRFVAAFEQVCQALAYAHAHQVIHRDLKPSNVMVGAFGEVQVMDWGLAKVLGARPADTVDPGETTAGTQVVSLRDSDGSFTQAGSVLGTPAFMPPEQAVGAVGKVDQRSDVFGLGAILAVILTGRPPFAASSAETTRIHAAQGKLDDCFRRLDACGADPELVALCKRCLCPEQAHRPADAGKVARAVAELRAAADDRARRAEIDRVKAEGEKAAAEVAAREQQKRRWVQAGLGLSFTALVVLGGTFAWWQDRQAADRRAERDRAARDREAEQRTRQSRTAAGVAANIREARERLGEAWELTDYPERMKAATDAALAAIGRADRFAADGEATPETAADLAGARAEVDDLARHTRLITEASGIVHQSSGGGPSPAEIPGRLLAALRRFGFDPCNDPEVDVVRLIATSRICDSLLAMLLEVELNIIRYKQLPMGKLSGVIRSLRQHLGGPYARWQELLDRKDVPGLVAFAGTPEALSFRAGVINALGRDLQEAGQPRAWQGLIRAAVARYPHDVWLHHDLFLACRCLQPSARAEALRHAAATVLLCPEGSGNFRHLADAYADLGDLDRACDTYREAIRLHPKIFYLRVSLARMLDRAGNKIEAIAVCTEALRLGKTADHYCYFGDVLRAGGFLDLAERAYREGVRLDGNHHGDSIDTLADLLLSRGNLDGALATYQQTLRIDPGHAATGANLARVQRMRELLPRLAGVLAGKDRPKSPAECCEFAQLCAQPFQKRYVGAARLYADAFATDPKLADDLGAGHRYNAACAAAQTGCGRGEDTTDLGDGERKRWRTQARQWLRAELAARARALDADPAAARRGVREALTGWREEPDLACVRDRGELDNLAADERKEYLALWAEVTTVLARTEK
jgi:tetratricopeptide (TPR) repeat protein